MENEGRHAVRYVKDQSETNGDPPEPHRPGAARGARVPATDAANLGGSAHGRFIPELRRPGAEPPVAATCRAFSDPADAPRAVPPGADYVPWESCKMSPRGMPAATSTQIGEDVFYVALVSRGEGVFAGEVSTNHGPLARHARRVAWERLWRGEHGTEPVVDVTVDGHACRVWYWQRRHKIRSRVTVDGPRAAQASKRALDWLRYERTRPGQPLPFIGRRAA